MKGQRINFLKDLEPRNLSELAGYEDYADILNDWLAKEKFPDAILFSGAMGVGKSLMASLLGQTAACLNRPIGGIKPCGACTVCKYRDTLEFPRYIGSQVDPKTFHETIANARSGFGALWLSPNVRWSPTIIEEFHELPKQAQRAIRAELDNTWHGAFLMGTTMNPQEVEPALRDRMYPIHILQPSKTPLAKWVAEICQRTGMELADPKVALLLVDLTDGRYRAMLMAMQQIHDGDGKLTEAAVRKACRLCGYSK